MKNYVNEGKTLTITAGSDLTSGDVVAVGSNLVGVAQGDAANGSECVLVLEGAFTLPAAIGVTAGDPVEWSGSSFETVSTGAQVGVALTSENAATAVIKLG